MSAWSRLGLRGRLAISIGAIVVLAFGAVFVVVRGQMANESSVIEREEAKKGPPPGRAAARPMRARGSRRSRTPRATSKRPSS